MWKSFSKSFSKSALSATPERFMVVLFYKNLTSVVCVRVASRYYRPIIIGDNSPKIVIDYRDNFRDLSR